MTLSNWGELLNHLRAFINAFFPQALKVDKKLIRSVIVLIWTQTVIHVRRFSHALGCKRKCFFVNPGNLVRHELGTKWSKCQYDTFKLIDIRIMIRFRISPKRSKLRTVFRRHAYRQVDFTDVPGNSYWKTVEAEKPVNRFVCSLGLGKMCPFEHVPWNLAVASNMILVFDVNLSGWDTGKWGR